MNDIQPTSLAATQNVAMPDAAAQWDDDLALGCECADPALQIEFWGQEAASGAATH